MRCAVCGRDFNPRGFQVVVPSLGRGFDRIECAAEASESGLIPATGAAALDPALLAAPVTAPAPRRAPAAVAPAALATSAGIVRAPLLSGGNLVLLAALTAGTVFLWLRVFAPGDLSISLPGGSAAPSFERGTVPAVIVPASPAGPVTRPVADGAVQADGLPTTTSPAGDKPKRHRRDGGSDEAGPGKPSGGGSKPSSRPASTPLTPPVQPTPPRSAPTPAQPSGPPSPGDTRPPSGGGGGGGHAAPSLPTQPTLPTLPGRN